MLKHRRPAGSRNHPVKSDISGAFSDGQSDIEGLKDEITEWKDNMESNNMENLPKFEEVSEAADNLDNVMGDLEGLEVPEHLQDIVVSFTIDTRVSAQSRSGRMSNALAALGAALDGARTWLEENEALEVTDVEELDTDELADLEAKDEVITQELADERDEQRQAAEEFADELENIVSAAEDVCFPGMY